ncbi:hypothetical protein GCM10009735_80810 [Actinomadura chokoriensis]
MKRLLGLPQEAPCGLFRIWPTAQPVNDGNWHHAVITAAGASQTLYLDGAEVGSLTGDIAGFEQKYVALGAGTWTSWPATTGDRGFFSGDIDELAVYNRPLGVSAIWDQAAAGSATARLTKTTLQSGRTDVQVFYDPVTERVSHYTSSDGGLWKVSPPVIEPLGDQAEGEVGEESALTTVTVTDPETVPQAGCGRLGRCTPGRSRVLSILDQELVIACRRESGPGNHQEAR